MEYRTFDRVLEKMVLEKGVPIRILVDESTVKLFIGLREWEWERGSGKLLREGLVLGESRVVVGTKKR